MKQSLQLKIGQSLTMSPQLQQAIRLLQLSTLELHNEIQEALDSNPMLEIVEEITEEKTPNNELNQDDVAQKKETTSTQDDTESDHQLDGQNNEVVDSDWNQNIPDDLAIDTSWDDVYQPETSTPGAVNESDHNYLESNNSGGDTLHDHLLWQLNLAHFNDRDHLIAITLIDAILPCGMLSIPVKDIYKDLNKHLSELKIEEVKTVLHLLQQFDPPGVGYQNLSECLTIQLNQLPDNVPNLTTAKIIVKEHIGLLGSKDYKGLMKKLRLQESELSQAIALIQTLNPRPGEEIGSNKIEYITPDVYVSKKEDRWLVKLNSSLSPKLGINSSYASLVKRADSSKDNTYLKENLQEARWFLKSLQNRNETLLKVASCIVEKQSKFFDYGEEGMRPLVLSDIAELINMHPSTVSRATAQKYMHTPRGIFELRYFFSSHVTMSSGKECSSTAICSIIKKLIAGEDRKKPLSDNKIAKKLEEKGINAARRTVAKYRESMSIPSSSERKQLV